jgi:hypothetical protein
MGSIAWAGTSLFQRSTVREWTPTSFPTSDAL